MDVLDHLAEPAVALSGRVDDVLAAVGAPGGHRIWPLLRRLRVLPGDAVQAVLALRPAPLRAAGDVTRQVRWAYDEASAILADGGSWQGPAAEAFGAHRGALGGHLADGADSLTARVDATVAYAEAVAEWIVHTRSTLARTLADVLGSAEAVTVVTARSDGGVPVEVAAAEIGARVLGTVVEACDRAEALPGRWAPDLAEVAYRPPDGPAPRPDGGRIIL